MTESQHGTLVLKSNNAVRIPGTVLEGGESLWVQFDGTSASNGLVRDEWDFEPDPRPLPTAIGSVIARKAAGYLSRFVLTSRGWQSLDFAPFDANRGTYYTADDLAQYSWETLYDAGAGS